MYIGAAGRVNDVLIIPYHIHTHPHIYTHISHRGTVPNEDSLCNGRTFGGIIPGTLTTSSSSADLSATELAPLTYLWPVLVAGIPGIGVNGGGTSGCVVALPIRMMVNAIVLSKP